MGSKAKTEAAVTFTEAQANLLSIVVWLGFGLLVFSDHILGVRDPARRHGRSTRAIVPNMSRTRRRTDRIAPLPVRANPVNLASVTTEFAPIAV